MRIPEFGMLSSSQITLIVSSHSLIRLPHFKQRSATWVVMY